MKINKYSKSINGINDALSNKDINKASELAVQKTPEITEDTQNPAEMLGRSMLLDINAQGWKDVDIPELTDKEFKEKLSSLHNIKWNGRSLALRDEKINKYNIFLIEDMINDGWAVDYMLHYVLDNSKTKSETRRLIPIYNALKDKNLTPVKMSLTLHEVNQDNFLLVYDMCNDNFIDKKDIANSISHYDSKETVDCKRKIYESLKRDDNNTGAGYISSILSCVTEDTYDLVNLLVNDADFPKDKISQCVKIDEPEYDFDLRTDIYGILKSNNVPSSLIASVLSSTNYENIYFVKRMCTDNIIPPNKIETAVNVASALNFPDVSTLGYIDFTELIGFPAVREEAYEKLLEIDEIRKNSDCFTDILSSIYKSNYDYAKKLLSTYSKDGIPVEYIAPFINISKSSSLVEKMSNKDIMNSLAYIRSLKQRALKNPERYVNGEHSPNENEAVINTFFIESYRKLFDMSNILDKETIDVLMRKRLDTFKSYLNAFSSLSTEDMYLLKNMCECVNIYEKPFTPAQKISFIDLITTYNCNQMDKSNIKLMIKNGKIDTAKLNSDMFYVFMKNAGMTDEEIALIPKEKLMSWDKRYAHLLSKNMFENTVTSENNIYLDILRASNLCDFETYINDASNKYGQANANTKQIFADLNLDYEKWIHPDKGFERDFVSKDKNYETLSQTASLIEEDLNSFMHTPVKSYIKKHFSPFIKADKFVLPASYKANKSKLTTLVKSLVDTDETGVMSAVWKRANTNYKTSLPESDKFQSARNTLTILEHLKQRLLDLNNIANTDRTKNLNLKIKMWDRIPQKDLFQGNYSQCCIGAGAMNAEAMPHYLMNTAFNMIEIVDNHTGGTIGNALCYFVKSDDGEPALVVDNIEISNSFKSSDYAGKNLRDEIANYLSDFVKSVTGKADTPIYMGNRYNDITTAGLPCINNKVIKFVGDIDCEKIYLG